MRGAASSVRTSASKERLLTKHSRRIKEIIVLLLLLSGSRSGALSLLSLLLAILQCYSVAMIVPHRLENALRDMAHRIRLWTRNAALALDIVSQVAIEFVVEHRGQLGRKIGIEAQIERIANRVVHN